MGKSRRQNSQHLYQISKIILIESLCAVEGHCEQSELLSRNLMEVAV
jgi:hypothetical protein